MWVSVQYFLYARHCEPAYPGFHCLFHKKEKYEIEQSVKEDYVPCVTYIVNVTAICVQDLEPQISTILLFFKNYLLFVFILCV